MDIKIGKAIGNYVVEGMLGNGQYGEVFLVRSNKDNLQYAIKCIKKSKIDSNPKLKNLLQSEVGIMNKINHQNVMHLYEFLESGNNYYMVIQYCNGGDLEAYCKKQRNQLLPENQALYYLKQIMNGFIVLRQEKVMHRDFKLANIFMHNDILVIGDFGFAKAGFDMAQTKLGTPVTMAPELHSGNSSYDSKADLWSIGVVFFEMLYGDNPFFGLNIPEIMQKIKKFNSIKLPFDDNKNRVSDLSKDLLRRLLEMEPERRIDWDDFFNHPVFAEKGQSVLNNRIEMEFQDNKHKNLHNPPSFIDPTSFAIKPPQIISDPTPSNSQRQQTEHDIVMKENHFRYLHEKNKIQLIFLTIKKLRQLMKDPDYFEMARLIYLLMMILAKKGSMLSELTIFSLNRKENIYKLNNFDQFCNNTREFQECLTYLQEDQQIIFAYHNYILGLRPEVNLQPEDENLISWLLTNYSDFGALDEKAMKMYRKIQEVPKPVKLTFNAEENRRFLLSMYYALHSIKCEILLPYVDQYGKKLAWPSLKVRFESMKPEELRQAISQVDR